MAVVPAAEADTTRPYGKCHHPIQEKKCYYFKILLNVEVLSAEIPSFFPRHFIELYAPRPPPDIQERGLRRTPKASPYLPEA